VNAADQAEHGRHVGHDVGVQCPQRGQVEGTAAACVPPGQQKVRNDPALPGVAPGMREQALERRHFLGGDRRGGVSAAAASIACAMT
jgi:hypothetical protein